MTPASGLRLNGKCATTLQVARGSALDSRRGIGPAIERQSAQVAPAPESVIGGLPQ